jgi:hypothetical protein
MLRPIAPPVFLRLSSFATAHSQMAAQNATGTAPFGSYSSGDIDKVDLVSGNISVHNP